MSRAPDPRPPTAAEAAATEAGWRALALIDCPRPTRPDVIPGLPGVNAGRLRAWREEAIAWRLCRAERSRFGIFGPAA